MTHKNFRDLIAQMQHQLEPLASLQKSLGGASGLARLVEDLDRQQELVRIAYGPMEELRHSGTLAALSHHQDSILKLNKEMEDAIRRFELPEIQTAKSLMEEFRAGPASQLAAQFLAEKGAYTRAVEAIRAPWLDMANQLRSVGAFANLQGIGLGLRTMPSFGDQFTDLLRDDLGDWRDQIAWPHRIFDDAVARAVFYEERGLDLALTAFPASAFEQSMDIAGLRSNPPELIQPYSYDETEQDGAGEAAFARNNAAHDRLQRFESQLRLFIDEQMTKAFGADWIKHRVPGDMRDRWIQKRDRARANGEKEYRLLAYADFTDYLPIIIQKKNWAEVFAPIFGRQTSVQESLQRLYPIRVCTMHARMITQDDELFLFVETHRVMIAIGVA